MKFNCIYLVSFIVSFICCFMVLRILKTKREIKEITNKINESFKHIEDKLKYRYSFSTCYSDYTDSTVFSSCKKYTRDEFYNICRTIIKNIVVANLNTMDIDDGINRRNIRKYFRMDNVLKEEFNVQMSLLGFEVCELDICQSVDIDAYSFIKDEFKEELSDIICKKCKINGKVTKESNFNMWLYNNNLDFLIKENKK